MTYRALLAIWTVILVIGPAATFRASQSASAPATVVFDIPGRSDATPWVAAQGSFVAVAWGASADGKTGDVFLAISRDSGASFGPPVQVNTVAGEARLGGEFPPRVTLLARPGHALPEVAVLWTVRTPTSQIKAARSENGGRTFAKPVALQSSSAPGDRGWPAVTFDPRGVIHAIWLDHRGLAAKRPGAAAPQHKAGVEHDGVAMAQKSALFYSSAPAAASARPRERQLTRGVCYCCKTAMAAGPDGSLYAAWRHVYPGNLRDMAFAVSRNGGRSFSAPIRVSEDGWAINGCPDDGPAMAVDSKGTVHMVWPTVIGGSSPQGAIFYASSTDGRRFTPRVRVPTLGGPKPSHPQIVVDGRGRVFVAWDESVSGRRSAGVREVRLKPNETPSFGDVATISTGGVPSYPVLASTDRGILAVWTATGSTSRVEAQLVPLR